MNTFYKSICLAAFMSASVYAQALTISPSFVSTTPSATTQFSTNGMSPTWGTTYGSISTGGLYTAPATQTCAPQLVITTCQAVVTVTSMGSFKSANVTISYAYIPPVPLFIPGVSSSILYNDSGVLGAASGINTVDGRSLVVGGTLAVNRAVAFSALSTAVAYSFSSSPNDLPEFAAGSTITFSGGGTGVVLSQTNDNTTSTGTLYLSVTSGTISGTFTATSPNTIVCTVTSTTVQTLSTGADVNGTINSSSGSLNLSGTPFISTFAPTGSRGTNLFLGFGSGNTTLGDGTLSNGVLNLGLGHFTLSSLTTGWDNVAVGGNVLGGTTTGTLNTGVGVDALKLNITGGSNTAVGSHALYFNLAGVNNTAQGQSALYYATGSHNTGTGVSALQGVLGSNTGSYNSGLGELAGATNQTGSQNVFLGYGADVASPALSNVIAAGYQAIVSASNTAVIGNGSMTDVYLGSTAGLASGHMANLTLNALSTGLAHVNSSGVFTSSAVNLASADVTVPGSPTQLLFNSAGVVGAGAGITTPDGSNLTASSFGTGTGGYTFNQSAQVVPNTANTPGSLFAIPSGTQTIANLGVQNSSSALYANTGLLRFHIFGGAAAIDTRTSGTGTPVTSLCVGECIVGDGANLTAISFDFGEVTQANISSAGLLNTTSGYSTNGVAGFSGTKSGACTFIISGGIITNVTGC